MRKNEVKQKILLVFLILFFCLLFFMVSLAKLLTEEEIKTGEISQTIENKENSAPTKKDIIKKYNSTYITEGTDFIKVVLSKDLFEENGSSNQKFVENIMNDLEPFYKPKDFYLIDEEKQIEIYARYKAELDDYEFVINKVEKFYEKVDGDAYIKVDDAEIAEGNNFAINNFILSKLNLYNFYLDDVAEDLGEYVELQNGYRSYQNGNILLKTAPTGAVKHIIFSDNYEEYITSRLTAQMSLKKVVETEPKYDFGGVEKGYIGYRQLTYYLFFYNDEVSVYTYSYKKNKTFEELLETYLETKDLDAFVRGLSKKWMAYDSFEYDKESQTAKIRYSTRGVDINIVNNDPKGITFYDNYYFTDYVKSLVKTGVVSFEPDVDLVEKVEIERRNND